MDHQCNNPKVLDAFKKSPKSNFAQVEATSGKTALHEVFLRDSAKHQDGREPRDASYAKGPSTNDVHTLWDFFTRSTMSPSQSCN